MAFGNCREQIEDLRRGVLFRIFNKLGTSNRLELALYALNHQLTNRGDKVD
jgi:hypothetical protein